MHNLAMVLQSIGNYKEAEKYYTQSLKLAEELGDKQGIASSLHQLGNIQILQGNYKEAEEYYTQSLKLAEELGDKHGIAQSLHQLGVLQQYQGNYKEAEKYYTQSLELKEELGDKQGIAISLGQLGRLSERREDYKEAVEHYIIALSLFLELGAPDVEIAVKDLKRVRKTIGGEQFDDYWKALTDQEVPDFIKYDRELEEFIQVGKGDGNIVAVTGEKIARSNQDVGSTRDGEAGKRGRKRNVEVEVQTAGGRKAR